MTIALSLPHQIPTLAVFRPNTLFVLGAGASCEVDMPSGTDLKKQIANDLNLLFDDWGAS